MGKGGFWEEGSGGWAVTGGGYGWRGVKVGVDSGRGYCRVRANFGVFKVMSRQVDTIQGGFAGSATVRGGIAGAGIIAIITGKVLKLP